jgi:hypothetical protein
MSTFEEDSPSMISQHVFMGDLNANLNELEAAEEQYIKALDLINKIPDDGLTSQMRARNDLFIKLGFISLLKGDIKSGEFYYKKALALSWDIITNDNGIPSDEVLDYEKISYFMTFIDYEMGQSSILTQDMSRLDDLTLYSKEKLFSLRAWKRYSEVEEDYPKDLYYLAYQAFYRRECHKYFGDNQNLKTDLLQEISVREEILINNEKDIANGMNLAWCYEMLQSLYTLENSNKEVFSLKEKEYALRLKIEKLLTESKEEKTYMNYIFCNNGAYLKGNQLNDTGEFYRLGTTRELNPSHNYIRIADYYYKNNDKVKAEEEYLKAVNLSEKEVANIKFKNSRFWYEINNQRLFLDMYVILGDQNKFDKILELCSVNREKINELQKQLSKENYINDTSANYNLQYLEQCQFYYLSKGFLYKGDKENAKAYCKEGMQSCEKLLNLTKSDQVKILLSYFSNQYSSILVMEKNYKDALAYANTACILDPQNEQFKEALEKLRNLR